MLTCLHDSKFISSLDLGSTYYHIKRIPKTRYRSAFTTIFDKYNFLGITFGIAQGLAYFTA